MRDSSDGSSSSSDDNDSTEDNGHAELRQEPALKRPSSNRDPASRITHYQPNLNLGNDSWELLKGGLENDERAVPMGHFDQNGSVSSWKSARNGGRQILETPDIADGSLCGCSSPLVIVGRVLKHRNLTARSKTLKSRVGTIKSVGSSLNLRLRHASASSLGSLKRKASSKLPLDKSTRSMVLEEDATTTSKPESPAPSVGVPKRHGHMLASTAPSTIWMVSGPRTLRDQEGHSSQQMQQGGARAIAAEGDASSFSDSPTTKKSVLTSFCKYPVKGSPSVRHQQTTSTLTSSRTTKSEIPPEATSQPAVPMDTNDDIEDEDDRPIPGAFPTPPSKRKQPFIFGGNSDTAGISNDQFGLAGDAVLEEMNRKLQARGITSIGQKLSKEEVLQQRSKEGRSWTGSMGEKNGPKGRFEEAHARQFARYVVTFSTALHTLTRRFGNRTHRMPSIVSGLKSKAAKPDIRSIASTDNLWRRATERSQHVGQMTPGKRKASDMTREDDDRRPLARTMSSTSDVGLQSADALLEDSPRVKRKRVGSGQGLSATTSSTDANPSGLRRGKISLIQHTIVVPN